MKWRGSRQTLPRGMVLQAPRRRLLLPLDCPTSCPSSPRPTASTSTEQLQPTLDRGCAGYVWRAWRQLAADQLDTRWREDGLAATLGVVPRHRRLLACLVDMLVEDGALRRSNGWLEPAPAVPVADPDAELARLEAAWPRVSAHLAMTKRCAGSLAGVLRGTIDPLHLLFEGGSLAAAEALYQETPAARAFNTLVRHAVDAVIATRGAGRLRVLEIGAGTGGTTTSVLPTLPPDQSEYTFTDLSPAFLLRAQEKFRAFPFVRYQTLDIEHDPIAQGFSAGAFDLILAANVLHATSDLRATLRHVSQLLAPDGTLVLLEGTRSERWVDLTFGLTEGWWRFTDTDLRTHGPAVNADVWRRVLHDAGFNVAIVPTSETAIPGSPLVVIVASRHATSVPGAHGRERWLVSAEDDEEAASVVAAIDDALGEVARATLDWSSRGEVAARLREASAGEPLNVVCVWKPPVSASIATEAARVSRDATTLVQGALDALAPIRLWWVTRGAQPADGNAAPGGAVAHAALWGLGRVVGLEHPAIWGGLIDLDPGVSLRDQSDLLCAVLRRQDGEDQVAVRAGRCLAPRLRRCGRVDGHARVRIGRELSRDRRPRRSRVARGALARRSRRPASRAGRPTRSPRRGVAARIRLRPPAWRLSVSSARGVLVWRSSKRMCPIRRRATPCWPASDTNGPRCEASCMAPSTCPSERSLSSMATPSIG